MSRLYSLAGESQLSPGAAVRRRAGRPTGLRESGLRRRGSVLARPVDLGDTRLEAREVLAGKPGALRRARHAEGIDRPTVAMQLEMQMRAGRQAAAADEADDLALPHARAAPHARRDARQVRVSRRQAALVADLDPPAVAAVSTGFDD